MHPMDENQNLFFFSDAPHLLKTVRNKLHNNKILQVKINYFTIIIILTTKIKK